MGELAYHFWQPLLSLDTKEWEISLPEWSWSKRWGSLSSPVLLLGLTGKAPVSWHFLFPLVSQLICFYSLSRPGFQANETHGMLYTKPLLSPTWWLRFCSLTVTVRSAGHSTAGWLSGTHHAFMTSQLLHEGDILCTAANRLWGEDLKSRPRWLYSLIFMHCLLPNISFHPQFLYLRNAHTSTHTDTLSIPETLKVWSLGGRRASDSPWLESFAQVCWKASLFFNFLPPAV